MIVCYFSCMCRVERLIWRSVLSKCANTLIEKVGVYFSLLWIVPFDCSHKHNFVKCVVCFKITNDGSHGIIHKMRGLDRPVPVASTSESSPQCTAHAVPVH